MNARLDGLLCDYGFNRRSDKSRLHLHWFISGPATPEFFASTPSGHGLEGHGEDRRGDAGHSYRSRARFAGQFV